MSNKYIDNLLKAAEEFRKAEDEYQGVKARRDEAEERFHKAQEEWDEFIEENASRAQFKKATRYK